MTTDRRRLLLLSCCLPALAAPAARAQPSDYPARPVRLIVPISAGQATDILARVLAEPLARALGQPFVIDNKPGAGTTLGTDAGARAAPDGYTLTMATSGGFAVAPAIYARLPYDPLRDFAPISNLGIVTQTLVTAADAPWRDLRAFVAAARTQPMNYASAGVGSTSHLAAEAFLHRAGITATHVPFKGASEAQPQVVGGQVQVMFDALPAVLPQVRAGRLRILGVGSAARTPLYPEAPTIAEQGLPGFQAIGWIGLAAPARTPPAILDLLNAEVRRAMARTDVRARLQALMFTPADGGREEFARFIAEDIARWGRVARDARIQPE